MHCDHYFSWDEIGKYDVSAMIDHILQRTNHSSLFYVGHSMATTVFWVAMNERPEYNQVIRGMIALGPTASVPNIKSPVNLIIPHAEFLFVSRFMFHVFTKIT